MIKKPQCERGIEIITKTAKGILAASFPEIAQKMTVKHITENCGYSLAAFPYFKEKYDLIAWNDTQGITAVFLPERKMHHEQRTRSL